MSLYIYNLYNRVDNFFLLKRGVFFALGFLFLIFKKKLKIVFIQEMLGAQVMVDYERYLGLPMVGGKSKVNTFKELQERVTKRVMGWKEKHISKVGREVLIKTVAQAIPTYSMSLFKIPKTICDGINSTLSKY